MQLASIEQEILYIILKVSEHIYDAIIMHLFIENTYAIKQVSEHQKNINLTTRASH